jgi:hypothetical protein
VHLMNGKNEQFGSCSSHSRGAVTRAMNIHVNWVHKDER